MALKDLIPWIVTSIELSYLGSGIAETFRPAKKSGFALFGVVAAAAPGSSNS